MHCTHFLQAVPNIKQILTVHLNVNELICVHGKKQKIETRNIMINFCSIIILKYTLSFFY